MKKWISCQKINKYIILMILACAVSFINNDFCFGFNYNDMFSEINLNKLIFNDDSKHHRLIEPIFNYIGTFFFGILLLILEKIFTKNKTEKEVNSRIKLIYYDNEGLTKRSVFYLLLMIIIWIIDENLITIISELLKDLDFWFLELIFLTIMLNFFFGVNFYKHHLFAIRLSIFPCILLKIAAIVLSFEENKDEKGGIGDLYTKRWYLVPVGIFSYLILIGIKSLTISGMKWFFDLKYVSHTTLLITYGLIGFIISFIFCVATTYIDCNKLFEKDIVSDICSFKYNENDNIYYFDNFKIYFKNFEPLKILLILFEVITFFIYKYFFVLIIKKYNPVYVIFSTPIIYLLGKIVLMLHTLIREHSFFDETKENLYFKKIIFGLDLSGDILSFFGFIIYLEIIVLKCCNLSNNIRKNIIKRSIVNYKHVGKVDETAGFSMIINEDEE